MSPANMDGVLDLMARECIEIHELLDGVWVPREAEEDGEKLSMAQRVGILTGLYVARIQTNELIARACASSASPK